MGILITILCVFSVCCLGYAVYTKRNVEKVNTEVQKTNQDLDQIYCRLNDEVAQLTIEKEQISRELHATKVRNETMITENERAQKQADKLLQAINDGVNHHKESVNRGFELYCDALEMDYQKREKEYDVLTEGLIAAYDDLHAALIKQQAGEQEKIGNELNSLRTELEKIRSTWAAAVQARRREEELKDKHSFYSLTVEEKHKKDIHILEEARPLLNDARPLLMAMWSAYYLKPANDLAARILGAATKTGIYKITHADSGICYIGQARDIKERWREHMKHGLGIDTPAGNKLYTAMQKYGITAFTFELLEECAAADLNMKEKYYIELYDSYNNGYNSNRGNSK